MDPPYQSFTAILLPSTMIILVLKSLALNPFGPNPMMRPASGMRARMIQLQNDQASKALKMALRQLPFLGISKIFPM